jgi:uncharacterized glyoxalase superfamily protein PhnB
MAAKKKAKKAVRKTTRKSAAKKQPAKRKRKQPETLRVRTVSAGLTVNNIQKSIAWYRDVLGLFIGEKWEQDGKLMGVEMRAGSMGIWLGQDDWAKGRDRVKGVGVRIYCSTAQDVDMLANGIKARGGVLDHDPQTRWGARDFGITDPDGYKLTIASAR